MSPVPNGKEMPAENHPANEGGIENEPHPLHVIGQLDSDSDGDEEGEEPALDGQEYIYTPLAQDPEGLEVGGGDSSDSGDDVQPPIGGGVPGEGTQAPQTGDLTDQASLPANLQVPDMPASNPEEILWNLPRASTTEPVDDDRAEQVKAAMLGFQLPSSHHPDWARNISDDDWKQQLLSRITGFRNPPEFRAKFDK